MAMVVFDTRVTGQRSRIIIKCRKSCKEKGRERREIFKNKDGFQNKIRTYLYLQNKINFNLFFIHHKYQDQVYHIHDIFSLHCCVQ